jgi:hypothetical protein
MPTTTDDPRAIGLTVAGGELIVRLADGRVLHVPVEKSSRLKVSTNEQLLRFRFIGRGRGVHWRELDEDLSTPGLLAWASRVEPAPGPQFSFHVTSGPGLADAAPPAGGFPFTGTPSWAAGTTSWNVPPSVDVANDNASVQYRTHQGTECRVASF